MTSANPRSNPAIAGCLCLALLVTTIAYWPGLNGGFVFDDLSFIVGNPELLVVHSELGAWVRAALSFPADHQGRWLTMISFAANHYLGGLDPFGYKLVNLGIHLGNGVLLFFALRALLALWAQQRPSQAPDAPMRQWWALAITALWLVLPIQLTAVLYVTQRLESLSNSFVFAGLWWYLGARLKLAMTGRGTVSMLVALVVATASGLLSKESAILLPVYTACVELVFFRDPVTRPFHGHITALYTALLLIPLLGGLYWLSTWIGTPDSYTRPFTMWERLLTEARVMAHYMQWVLLPLPSDLTLYHDDIRLSTGLLSPPQTLAAIALITTLLGIAVAQAKQRPLISIGIFWFFAGHLLTGTVIPLELVFEHRNYFPSAGLLLAAAGWLIGRGKPTFKGRLLTIAALLLFGFYASATALRAREWSSPLRLALAEASLRPDSPRGQYELAFALINAAGRDFGSPLRRQALAILEKCSHMPGALTTCDGALIMEAARTGQLPKQAWWDAMTRKLGARAPSVTDFSVMAGIFQCQVRGACPYQPKEFGKALEAAFQHPTPSPLWLDLKAQYEAFFLGRPEQSILLFREVIRRQPNAPNPRGNLVRILIQFGRTQEARKELAELQKFNHLGSLNDMIEKLTAELAATENESKK